MIGSQTDICKYNYLIMLCFIFECILILALFVLEMNGLVIEIYPVISDGQTKEIKSLKGYQGKHDIKANWMLAPSLTGCSKVVNLQPTQSRTINLCQ